MNRLARQPSVDPSLVHISCIHGILESQWHFMYRTSCRTLWLSRCSSLSSSSSPATINRFFILILSLMPFYGCSMWWCSYHPRRTIAVTTEEKSSRRMSSQFIVRLDGAGNKHIAGRIRFAGGDFYRTQSPAFVWFVTGIILRWVWRKQTITKPPTPPITNTETVEWLTGWNVVVSK